MTDSISLTALSWLATYLVHSTLLIGCVWAFTGACSLDSLTRSLLWKLALVGGLFTATLQTGLGVQPALGLSTLTASEPAPQPVPAPERLSVESRLLLITGHEVIRVDEQGVCVGPGCALPAWGSPTLTLAGVDIDIDEDFMPELLAIAEPPAPPVAAVAPETPSGGTSAGWLVGLFAVGSAASLLRLGFLARRLRRTLRGRTPVKAGPLHERLAALVARARVRRLPPPPLTVSAGLRSPVALASGEIVVPPEALELEARQQEAMLAHELAHVLRRDPAWLVLAAVIEALLFIQPLNRVARRGMQEAAEELSDDWAVRHIGGGLHLARCLTEVAGWLDREHERHDRLASPMASGSGSLLVRRVRRLLAQQPGARRMAGVSRVMLALGLLLAVSLGAPGFAPPVAQASSPPAPSDVIAATDRPDMRVLPFVAVDGDEAPELAALSTAAACDANAPASARERRLARRAARLERRAEQLRERSGTAAPRFAVSPANAPGAHIEVPDEAELRRIVAEAQRSIPSEAELRRIVAEAQRSIPSEAELRKILADAQGSIPDEAELRRIVADAQRSIPSEAELRRIVADAQRSIPSEAELRKILADARSSAGQELELEARELAEEMANLGQELAREAEEIEREVRDELEAEGLLPRDPSRAPSPPRPPMPPRPGVAPRAPMPPMPPAPPMGAPGRAPLPPGAAPMPPTPPSPPMGAPGRAPMPPAAPPAPHGSKAAPMPPAPPAPPAPTPGRQAKRTPV